MSQNSSNAFDQPLLIRFNPSPTLLTGLLVLYALAVLAWLWVPVSWPVRLALYGLLGGHFVFLYRLHVRASLRWAIQAVSWDPARGWQILRKDGVWQRAKLVSPLFVSHGLVAVRFSTARFRRHSLIVVADRLAADDFRRFRVRLLQS